jgi:hypothetical protein
VSLQSLEILVILLELTRHRPCLLHS